MTASESSLSAHPAPKISISKLGLKRNKRWLFRDLELSVPAGSFVAVVGPSGAGKSSLLACLGGQTSQTEGALSYSYPDGAPLPLEQIRPQLGLIYQNFNLIENATVLRNILCGRLNRLSCLKSLWGFPRHFKKEAFAIMHDLGLSRYTHRWVAEISGGEKQRVAIARTLFQNPMVYLADEPVSQLDVYLAGRVLGLLKLQTTQHRKTVFCVLHDPSLVARFADLALGLNPEQPGKWRHRRVNA